MISRSREKKLLLLREEVLRESKRTLDESADGGDGGVVDLGDQAARERLRQKLHGLSERQRNQLLRVDQGNYGTCAACGRPLGEERLLAVPLAVECRTCRERREQQEGPP